MNERGPLSRDSDLGVGLHYKHTPFMVDCNRIRAAAHLLSVPANLKRGPVALLLDFGPGSNEESLGSIVWRYHKHRVAVAVVCQAPGKRN